MCLVGGEAGERSVDFGRKDEGGVRESRGIAFCTLDSPLGFRRCEDGGLEEGTSTVEGGDCGLGC